MNASDLRVFILERFSDDELRVLAFDLGIPFDDLGAPDIGLAARVQALLEWCIRHGRLAELEQAARIARGARRQGVMADGYTSLDYSQVQRLIAVTDEMNRNMAKLVTDIEVLKLQVSDLQKRFTELERHAAIPPPASWQAWLLAGVALLAAATTVASLLGVR